MRKVLFFLKTDFQLFNFFVFKSGSIPENILMSLFLMLANLGKLNHNYCMNLNQQKQRKDILFSHKKSFYKICVSFILFSLS
jgi:hypothetical protein